MAKLRLSAGFGGLSGRAGNVVYAQTAYGTILKERPTGRRRESVAQSQVSQNLRRANAAWRALSLAQVQAWQVYCLGLQDESLSSGSAAPPVAAHVFLGYATKILQMNPEATVPTDPPAMPFYGDSVRVTASGGTGEITAQASAANAPGIATEILVQRLRQINNSPQRRSYKSAAFRSFAQGGLTLSVPVAPGAYAVAIRFVDVASGRMTPMYMVGRTTVA